MNRAASSFLLPFASLVLAATAFAQTAPAPSAATVPPNPDPASASLSRIRTIILSNTLIGSCPVGLRAQPGTGPGMVVVGTGHDSASQKLNLQFSNPGGRGAITHARITVHGFTAHGRVSPVISGQPDASIIAKEVDLPLDVAPGANASTDMLFQGFTSVRWIDLDSLTYADGSTWHSSPQHACQVTPDRVMLIASH